MTSRSTAYLRIICTCLLALSVPSLAETARRTPVAKKLELSLNEVISTSLEFHPLVLAAETERDATQAELLSSQGAFDPVFKADSGTYAVGDYSGTYSGAGVELPLELGGAKILGGYRRSGGTFPVYENQFETNPSGEARIGVELPLLRDSLIDKRRQTIQKNTLQKVVAESNIEVRKIEMSRLAQITFWEWVAARHRYLAVEELLDVARERQKQVDVRVSKGDLPDFDRVDNERTILQRQQQLLMAQQALRRVEFELSLLLRDQQGNPRSVAEYKEPKAFPSTSVKSEVGSLAVAEGLLKRPELQRIDTQLMQNQQELVLAQNQFLPRLDATVMGAKDYGDGSTSRDEAELKVGIKVEIPLMMRTQDGRRASLQAKQRELQAMKNHLQQRISVEIRDALMVLGLARDRIGLVSKEVSATQALEKGERTRYELGDSNLIFVNLREQTATDARIREIDAHLDYCKAQAAYRAATGIVYSGD